ASNLTARNTYYIITGSFQSEENAGKQVSQLQAEGFNPEVVAAGNGFYRVCAMECPDLTTAVSRKDSILGKFPGAWISRKK
ncbi:MAG: SPOR domain-containing protein, partial [Chloroflexota bacterium]